MRRWQLQTAKAKFSELFRKTLEEGPQLVTRQGKEAVIVLPVAEFERLRNRGKKKSLAQLFAESPLVGIDLDLERDKDFGREIDL